MTATPMTPERLREIAALCETVHRRNASVKFGDPRYVCSVNSKELLGLVRAIPDLLAEVARLQGVVLRLANNERDLAETNLVLEQQDRDIEKLKAREAQLIQSVREACNWIADRSPDGSILVDRLRAVADRVQSQGAT
jgi:hypothetical protein